MESFKETALFWIVFGILMPVIFSRFYFQTGEKRLNQLRFTSIGLQLTALFLLFLFPWHVLLPIYGIALAVSIFFLAYKKSALNKVGSAISLANSFFLFTILLSLFPETKKLVASDVPPIISVVLMLVNNVAVLLFWHQLQKRKQK